MRYEVILLALLLMQTSISPSAKAQDAAAMIIAVGGIEEGQPIPEKFASCTADGKGATRAGGNISPEVIWSGAPGTTKSYVVIVVDKDVPVNFESANKAGKTIATDAPRRDFYHWVLVDIPTSTLRLPEGGTPPGMVGRNDMGSRSKSANGYDGPCPPWNDELLHHYHFQVYALDIPSLGLKAPFTGPQVKEAMKDHILAKSEVVGTYTTNQTKKKAAQ